MISCHKLMTYIARLVSHKISLAIIFGILYWLGVTVVVALSGLQGQRVAVGCLKLQWLLCRMAEWGSGELLFQRRIVSCCGCLADGICINGNNVRVSIEEFSSLVGIHMIIIDWGSWLRVPNPGHTVSALLCSGQEVG